MRASRQLRTVYSRETQVVQTWAGGAAFVWMARKAEGRRSVARRSSARAGRLVRGPVG